MKVVGAFMVRKMRDRLVDARASEASMRDSQASLHAKFVRADQKSSAIERELMIERRRHAEREAAYEQQRSDSADLSVENRMLLEKTEQLIADSGRYVEKLERLEAENVELGAQLQVRRLACQSG